MAPETVRAQVTRQRQFRAFAELSYGHWVILDNAKAQREGVFYICLTANILAAFKVEAYFNHLGAQLFDNWEQEERQLSKRKKLDRILAHVHITIDNDDERYQTLESVFRFRDAVAHARTESLAHSESIEEGHIETLRRRKPLAEWEEHCTLQFATRAYEHTESIIRDIHVASGRDEAELSRSGDSYSIKVLDRLGS